jgi:hypothetical protein
LLVQPPPGLRDDPRAGQEALAHLGIGDQVLLAVAIARLRVLEAVELVWRRAQALGQELPRGQAQRQLAPLGLECRALDADDVAEVEGDQLVVAPAQVVRARLELNPSRAVHEVEERGLAHVAASRDPARHAVRRIGFFAVRERVVSLAYLRDLDPPLERVREGLHATIAQPLELLAPLGDDRRLVAFWLWRLVAHRREPTRPRAKPFRSS